MGASTKPVVPFGHRHLHNRDLGVSLVHILEAIIVGMGLVNWAVRRGYVEKRAMPSEHEIEDLSGLIPMDDRPQAGRLTVKSDVIESLSLHLAFVGAAILIGWALKQGLLLGASHLPEKGAEIFQSFPLFPLCMLGGVIVQWLADRYDTWH